MELNSYAKDFLTISCHMVAGGLAARYLTPLSMAHGLAIGGINGFVPALIYQYTDAEKHPIIEKTILLTSFAGLILGQCLLAPKLLRGRVAIPSPQDFLIMALPSAFLHWAEDVYCSNQEINNKNKEIEKNKSLAANNNSQITQTKEEMVLNSALALHVHCLKNEYPDYQYAPEVFQKLQAQAPHQHNIPGRLKKGGPQKEKWENRIAKNNKKAQNEGAKQDCSVANEIADFNVNTVQPIRIVARAFSNAGLGTKPNQDKFYISQAENTSLAAVFDGHGRDGAHVADFAATHVQQLFTQAQTFVTGNNTKYSLIDAFEITFRRLQIELLAEALKNPKLRLRSGGTTGVLAFINHTAGHLFVATLGDSEANIYRRKEPEQVGSWISSISASPLRDWSTDKKRIQDASTFVVKNTTGENKTRHIVNQTNVSRSLEVNANYSMHHISIKPKVTAYHLQPGDIVTLVSDGVKDNLSEKEIITIISENSAGNAEDIGYMLVTKSVEIQSNKTKTSKRKTDNATALVIKIEKAS